MEILIRSHGFSLTDALVERVDKRLATALRHGGRGLIDVTVRLRDLNGPRRGGIDKRCRVELRFNHGRPVIINETDSNLYVAIDRAATRTKQAMLERARRVRTRRRGRERLVPA